jgi:site-specific DNA-methyltransferase (adenine-specific)
VKIDNEFRALIPPLSADEYAQLEANIIADGCRDPLVVWDGTLIDGHNRHKICAEHGIPYATKEHAFADRDAAIIWIIKNQFGRRNLTPFTRAELGLRMEDAIARRAKAQQATSTGGKNPQLLAMLPKAAIHTRAEVAKAAGIGERSIDKVKHIKAAEANGHVDAKTIAALRDGKSTINAVYHNAKKATDKANHAKELADGVGRISSNGRASIESVCDLRVMPCRELFASGIRPDAVITDPPYPREFLPVFTELAEACAFANVPLVAVMSGQSYLPEVMARLCAHLKYRWTLAYLTPGGQAVQQWPVKVNTTWKPVLLFGESVDWFGDTATSKLNDKRYHHWGQSESGMADLIERLTKPGQLVCDPFLGGGTTAVVSLATGRRFVGCDIDESAVLKTRERVEAQLCQM